jgi:hypothetical protein
MKYFTFCLLVAALVSIFAIYREQQEAFYREQQEAFYEEINVKQYEEIANLITKNKDLKFLIEHCIRDNKITQDEYSRIITANNYDEIKELKDKIKVMVK